MTETEQIPMRKISQESAEKDIDEKMHELKKTIGERIGEKIGVFELNTLGVVLLGKSSLKAIKVAFSFAVYHHIHLVIFSRAKKSLEKQVTNKAGDIGINYQLKSIEKISDVDLLVVSSRGEVPKNYDAPVVQVI